MLSFINFIPFSLIKSFILLLSIPKNVVDFSFDFSFDFLEFSSSDSSFSIDNVSLSESLYKSY
jgi:hypothetical protein